MNIDIKIDIKEIYALLDDAGKKVLRDYIATQEVRMKPTEEIVKNVLGITSNVQG